MYMYFLGGYISSGFLYGVGVRNVRQTQCDRHRTVASLKELHQYGKAETQSSSLFFLITWNSRSRNFLIRNTSFEVFKI